MKKGMAFMTGTVLALIVVALVSTLYVVFFVKGSAISSDPIVAQCQQSAALAGVVRAPVIDEGFLDFACPISTKTIKASDIDDHVDSKKLKESGYPNNVIYNTNKEMWQQAVQCYQKVNYGQMAIFDRGGWLGQLAATQPTYCVICSVISFEETAVKNIKAMDQNADVMVVINNPNTNYVYFAEKSQVPGTKQTLVEILEPRTDVLGALDTTFAYDTNQAVIYYRNQVKWFSKLAEKFPSLKIVGGISNTAFDSPFLLIAPQVTAPMTLSALSANIANYPTQDSDGVVIIPYDPLERDALNGLCDIIGNEEYIGVS